MASSDIVAVKVEQEEAPAIPSVVAISSVECPSYNELLDGAKDDSPWTMAAAVALLDTVEFRPFGMSHQEALATVTTQVTGALSKNHVQIGHPSFSSVLSPVSLTQSMPSAISLNAPDLSLLVSNNNIFLTALDKSKLCDGENNLNSPSNDGYKWQKYGPKHVKTSSGFQSYYKCTYHDCHAKKRVQRCDSSSCAIENIYIGTHNHNPHSPRKIKRTGWGDFVTSSSKSFRRDNEIIGHPNEATCGAGIGALQEKRNERKQDESAADLTPQRNSVKSKKKVVQATGGFMTSWSKSISGDNEIVEHPNEAACGAAIGTLLEKSNERMQDESAADLTPQRKFVKNKKIVVQAAGESKTIEDGYKWHRSGQTVPKGSPNPRSYYRCTSPGCPARRYMEKSMEDTTAIIVTYVGNHDHDLPEPVIKVQKSPVSNTLHNYFKAVRNGSSGGEKALKISQEKPLHPV